MQSNNDKYAVETDRRKKQIMQKDFDRRKKVKEADIKINDIVLVKQKQLNKIMPAFEPFKYKITDVKGNMVSADCITYNANDMKKSLTRNITLFKKWRGKVEEIETKLKSHTKSERALKLDINSEPENKMRIMVPLEPKRNKKIIIKKVDSFKKGFEHFVRICQEQKEKDSFESKLVVTEIVN
jgi:hypothetical protein